jgi:diguanylate cyclase (GGDEF)-like protein
VASTAGFPSGWNRQQAETMVSEFALLADLNRICRPEIVTNFYPRGGVRQDPSTPSALSGLYFPFIYGDQVLATLFLARTLDEPGLSAFSQDDLALMTSFAAIFTPAIRNAQLHAEVKKLAVTDPLTQVNNRRGFLDSTLEELEKARQTRQSVSGLMIDIDHFKEINDSYGHAVGDQVIQEMTRRLKTCLRAEDYVGRFGGDEFVVLLSGIDQEAGYAVAERIREKVSQTSVLTDRGELEITISVGVAQFDPDEDSADELLDHADRALYVAKRNGRNRTEVWAAECLNTAEV